VRLHLQFKTRQTVVTNVKQDSSRIGFRGGY
jgi:hypothetical protein